MKMLESSDIECSSDDDPDWELPKRQVAAAADEEEQSEADFDHADTNMPTSSCATQTAPPGKYIWKEESFEEKSRPPYNDEHTQPPSNVRTPLEYFYEYFDDSFFENAAEKTNMYCMSTGFDHIPMVDPIKNARCCRLPGCLSRSRTRCTKCDVYLCLTSERNCFKTFHTKA